MKKYLCEIYDHLSGEHIHWLEVFAYNKFDAEGAGRIEFSRLFRHTKKFKHVHKDSWRVRSVEI